MYSIHARALLLSSGVVSCVPLGIAVTLFFGFGVKQPLDSQQAASQTLAKLGLTQRWVFHNSGSSNIGGAFGAQLLQQHCCLKCVCAVCSSRRDLHRCCAIVHAAVLELAAAVCTCVCCFTAVHAELCVLPANASNGSHSQALAAASIALALESEGRPAGRYLQEDESACAVLGSPWVISCHYICQH